jgi:DNA polymerase-3 subunit beta
MTDQIVTAFLPIPADMFKAASLFCAVKDIRYYLNGITVQILPDKSARIMASNGHILGLGYLPPNPDTITAPPDGLTVIIPEATVIAAAKVKGDMLFLRRNGEDWELSGAGCVFPFDPYDATPLNYTRVIPREASGKAAQFNPEYLARFAKARKALGGNPETLMLAHNGDGAATAILRHDFLAVIMPMRGDPAPVPAWAFGMEQAEQPQAEEQAAA